MLLLIAAGPFILKSIWHHYYKHISLALGGGVITWFLIEGNGMAVAETGADYFSFICLLGSLFVISGGISIFQSREATAGMNVRFFFVGAVMANFIGTTGASMLLIRPFIRANKYRIQPYHIVFFIFIVSNAGGLITPLGDPPLFFGYLKGVPAVWNLEFLTLPWVFMVSSLCLIFWLIDRRNDKGSEMHEVQKRTVKINGKRNFIGLGIIVGSLFLDPHLLPGLPTLTLGGEHFSFLRELIQLATAAFFYFTADKTALSLNKFTFEPILEVVFLFFGIFFTMIPALEAVEHFAVSETGRELLTPSGTYFISGVFSSFLDNAPTYINVLAASMAKVGLHISHPEQVLMFVKETAPGGCIDCHLMLLGISLGSVLWGAMTYIGNGPNFMVKSIAEAEGVKMPSFFEYIYRYSLVLLLPLLLAAWGIFIYSGWF